MATEVLVESRIDDGRRIIEQLVQDDFEVTVAFWIQTTDEGLWKFYIASPLVEPRREGRAYPALFESLRKLSDIDVQITGILMINDADPMARDALAIRERDALRPPTRYRNKRLGDVLYEEVFVYPEIIHLPEFENIKQRFPWAELFAVEFPKDPNPQAGVLEPITPLHGKVNATEFQGQPPETLLFLKLKVSSRLPTGRMLFARRPEGWNTVFNPATKRWEEVVGTTGKKLFETADFGPLEALKRPE